MRLSDLPERLSEISRALDPKVVQTPDPVRILSSFPFQGASLPAVPAEQDIELPPHIDEMLCALKTRAINAAFNLEVEVRISQDLRNDLNRRQQE